MLVITQPRGLQIGTTVVIGAAAVWALGIVHINDVQLAPKLHLRVYRAFLSNQARNWWVNAAKYNS